MSIEPFLHRELVTSARSGSARRARIRAAFLILIVYGLMVAFWDWRGWDRETVRGAADFGLATFGVVSASLLFVLTFGAESASLRIASERDKKTLDVLLATRIPSEEVVFGCLGSEFVRFANEILAALPCVVLLVALGGVDLRFVWVAGFGVLTTWFAVVSIGLAVSAVARTGLRAASAVISLLLGWMFVPFLVVVLKPMLWPNGPGLVVDVALVVVRTSPMGLIANLSGFARFGSMADALLRMGVSEILIGAACLVFAVVRLRPGSRAVHDAEAASNQASLRKLAKAALRRRPRPACGDDPVYWITAHALRPSRVDRITGFVISAALLILFGLGLYRFGFPAFVELYKHGYGASPGVRSMPDPDPLVVAFLNMVQPELNLGPEEGTARLSFNMAIREFSACFILLHTFGLVAQTARSIETERRRETWLGLLATPLSGKEILRGKLLGSLVLLRASLWPTLLVWTLGLAAGALYPPAFLAGVVGLVILSGNFALLSIESALVGRSRPGGPPPKPIWAIASILAWVFALPVVPALFAFCTLLSYEDVAYARRTGMFLSLKSWFGWGGARAEVLTGVWLAVMTVGAAVLFLQARHLLKNFDAAVGRPVRTTARIKSDVGGTGPHAGDSAREKRGRSPTPGRAFG